MAESNYKCPRCNKPTIGHKGTAQACKSCTDPDWSKKCIVCMAIPVMPITEMCGPCTFGEAETANGNW